MRARLSLTVLLLTCACGDEGDGGNDCAKAEAAEAPGACDVGRINGTHDFTESAEELARDDFMREKGASPACFAFEAGSFCDYNPQTNITRCKVDATERDAAYNFRVEWHDEGCGLFRGDAFREDKSGAKGAHMGKLTRRGKGDFSIETDGDFSLEVTIMSLSPITIGVSQGSCMIDLRERQQPANQLSKVSLCQ